MEITNVELSHISLFQKKRYKDSQMVIVILAVLVLYCNIEKRV
jgi:hypothetical protein